MDDKSALPPTWHNGPDDSFHGKITADGPFKPEKGRYHFYIGLFCPFAHRANLIFQMKQLEKYAGIETSILKAYPKGDEKGWPGWQFNHDGPDYEGATVDKLFGSRYLHELYFKADADYKGRYSVPVLWDKKLGTIVNNESAELLRDLGTCFNSLLPDELAKIDLYPESLHKQIDHMSDWLQQDLNTRVYKTGFAPDQKTYEENVVVVFATLNVLEAELAKTGGPYVLGKDLTEVDIRLYATLIRFDTAYHQHFKCNLGEIRRAYPMLNNWLKNLYWNHSVFKDTTDFRHIKENYTKSHYDINPKAITPLGPWPDIEEGVQSDWKQLRVGRIQDPRVIDLSRRVSLL